MRPGAKNIFALPPTKIAEFERKIGAKARKKQKQNIFLFVIFRHNKIH